MINYVAGTTLTALFAANVLAAESVSESRVWTDEYSVSSVAPKLTISNIWGSVRVRSGPEGKISVTVDERRSAPNQIFFERSKELLKLSVDADSDGVSIIVGERSRVWRNREPCPECRVDYQFDVIVPPGTRLDVGTVVDGAIDVAGVAGTVSARNVNGPIRILELQNCQMLESVNGAVDLDFLQAPGENCDIETINGDVTLTLPDGSGLDVALDSYNGRLFSGFKVNSFALPAQVEHTRDDGRHRYRIRQAAGLRLEGGGPVFSISSLNGDIRIQKYQ